MDDKTKTCEFKDKESDSSDDFDVLSEDDSESNAAAYMNFALRPESFNFIDSLLYGGATDRCRPYEGAVTSKPFEGVSEKKGENEQEQLHPHETHEKGEMLRKNEVLHEQSSKHQQKRESYEVRRDATDKFKDKETDSSDDFDVLSDDCETNAATCINSSKIHESIDLINSDVYGDGSDRYGPYEELFMLNIRGGDLEEKDENKQEQSHSHEMHEKGEMLRKNDDVLLEETSKHRQEEESEEVRIVGGTVKYTPQNVTKNDEIKRGTDDLEGDGVDRYGPQEGLFNLNVHGGDLEKEEENKQKESHPHETREKKMLRKDEVLKERSPNSQQKQENQEVRFVGGTIKDISQNVETNDSLLQKVTPQTKQEQEGAQKALTSVSLIDRKKCLAREKIKSAMLKIIKVERTQREMDAAIKDKPQNEREKYWSRKVKRMAIQQVIENQILQRGLGRVQDEPLTVVEIRRIMKILNREIWRQNNESEWVNVEREVLEQEIFQNERDKCLARREIKEALREILLCEKIQRIMDESELDDSQKDRDYIKIRKEIEESMWLINLQNEPELIWVDRECIVATEVAQHELEFSTIKTEINRAKQNIIRCEQESDRVRREIEKASQESRDVKEDASEALQFNASYF